MCIFFYHFYVIYQTSEDDVDDLDEFAIPPPLSPTLHHDQLTNNDQIRPTDENSEIEPNDLSLILPTNQNQEFEPNDLSLIQPTNPNHIEPTHPNPVQPTNPCQLNHESQSGRNFTVSS